MVGYFTPSEKAKEPSLKPGRKPKYDWDIISTEISMGFDKNEIKLTTLKSMVYKRGKSRNKRFVVIEHPEHYEVAIRPGDKNVDF